MSDIQDEAYTELCEENARLCAEIKALRFALAEEQHTIDLLAKLCMQAANALENWSQSPAINRHFITELRKAAE